MTQNAAPQDKHALSTPFRLPWALHFFEQYFLRPSSVFAVVERPAVNIEPHAAHSFSTG
jgi:hypothetical protein